MSRCLRSLFVGLALISVSTNAFALVSGQGFVGRRWYDLKSAGNEPNGIKADEIQASVLVDPIPLVPIAAGLSLASINFDADNYGFATEIKIFEVGLDLVAWLPMVPIVTPYAKIKIPLMSTWEAKYHFPAGELEANAADGSTTAKVSGTHINIGIKYSIAPLTSLLLEIGTANEKIKFTEGVQGSQKVSGSDIPAATAKSSALRLGVEVGI